MRSYPTGLLGESFGSSFSSPKQQPSPQLNSPLAHSGSQADIEKLSQQLASAHAKLASWEQAWSQARQACEAWKKEAEDSEIRAKKVEQERLELAIELEKVTFQKFIIVVLNSGGLLITGPLGKYKFVEL